MSALKKYFKTPTNTLVYRDKTFDIPNVTYDELINSSSTLYVGDLNESVTEERIWGLFKMVGEIRRVIMGIHRVEHTPCGFCFVEFYNRKDALNAIDLLNGFRIDDSCIKCDVDYGFKEGRQYGRGLRGGQIKNDSKRRK